ncbi:MAG: hypothetical protein JNM56_22800 [Planctomycetia bacterium]|nr:hypothetical protein [Planctomycetia bacterium]
MTADSRPSTRSGQPNPPPADELNERTGGDVLVVVAFLAAFVILCVLGLASFVIGFFSR